MGSIFGKDPGKPAPLSPYARERIDREIAHLKKRRSVRDPKERDRSLAAWLLVLIAGGLLWLFFMDPVLYGFKRGDAIKAYLYLHGYGSDVRARQLAQSGIFTPHELDLLNQRQGDFQAYYSSPLSANEAAAGIVHYMKQLDELHGGHPEQLDALGKVRYQLFVRWGLQPPTHWSVLDPAIPTGP